MVPATTRTRDLVLACGISPTRPALLGLISLCRTIKLMKEDRGKQFILIIFILIRLEGILMRLCFLNTIIDLAIKCHV